MNFEELKNVVKQQEMDKYFEQRTDNHIKAVQKYCKALEDQNNILFKGLTERSLVHDQSKFSNEEIMPYTYYTWKRKCKNEGTQFTEDPEMEKAFGEAWKHHYTINSHHPEYHENGSDMTTLDIAEMIADWHAVGVELGNTAREFFDKKVGSKYGFVQPQVNLIYELIEILENLPEEENNEY